MKWIRNTGKNIWNYFFLQDDRKKRKKKIENSEESDDDSDPSQNSIGAAGVYKVLDLIPHIYCPKLYGSILINFHKLATNKKLSLEHFASLPLNRYFSPYFFLSWIQVVPSVGRRAITPRPQADEVQVPPSPVPQFIPS